MKIINITILFCALLVACSTPQDKNQYETKVLLKGVTTDVLGDTIDFPDSNSAITSAIRVLKAGETTGIHMHEGIPVVYMIEGEITITSENGEIQKVVKKGEAFIGSTNNWHETTNTGNSDAVAQVVFIGATDLKNTINKE
tara:strand:+ start:201 stop:623 length:423 start_codon:yes stop_codon:yes gene_type:complete